MDEFEQFYVWRGVGAIDDLDAELNGLTTYHEKKAAALRALQRQTGGDWTLWFRRGNHVWLLAVKLYHSSHLITFTNPDA